MELGLLPLLPCWFQWMGLGNNLDHIIADTAHSLHAAPRKLGALLSLDRLWVAVESHRPQQCGIPFHAAVPRDLDIGAAKGEQQEPCGPGRRGVFGFSNRCSSLGLAMLAAIRAV